MDYKEMTIEQKAKAYDEAIEKFDMILNLNTVKESGTIFADDVRKILPKLAESEDERIRKSLIDMLKNDEKCYLKEIAWLEKQGEQKPVPKFKVGDVIRLKGSAAEYTIKKVTDTTYYTNGWSCGIERCEEDYELVEQKPYGLREECKDCQCNYAGECKGSCAMNRNEQKPIKVPKFKVGDFIQFNGMGHTRYTIKEVCGLSHYINTCDKRMDMSYTDANFELVEQKPWSEEDELCLTETLYLIRNSYSADDKVERLSNWLKSLKDRVQLQPKQEWSEEDENHVKSILSTIECCKAQFPNAQAVVEAYNADINWLKSLRPQSLWKPSDEQIKVCKKVYADILSAKGFDLGTVNGELNRLEEELKKLKG